MKKSFILIIAVIALLTACKDKKQPEEVKPVKSSAERTSLQENHLLGAVKEVIDTKYMIYPAPDGTDSLVFFATSHDTYNEKGWLCGNVITDSKNDTISYTKISFDEKGHVILRELFDKEGIRREYSEYKYDKKGYRIQELTYVKDSLVREQTCTNDPQGNIEQSSVIEGKEHYYLRNTNNNNGLPVRIDWFADPSATTPYMQANLEYDNRGNVINRSVILNSRSVEYYHAQYNEKGHLLKEVYQRSVPENLVEISTTYSKHDSHGNWTYQENSRNDIHHFVIKREIIYFK